MTDVVSCQSDCLTSKESCADSTAANKCTVCMLLCSEAYDSAMRKCLSTISRGSKMTYNSGQADCESYASYDMDSCAALCSAQNGLIEQNDDFSEYYTPGR